MASAGAAPLALTAETILTVVNVNALRTYAMDSRLQGLIITIVTIVVTAVAQHFAVLTPTQTRAEANRDANFEARDQLKVCLQALSNEMAD